MFDHETARYDTDTCSRLTLDIIGPAAMGRDFRSLQNSDNPVAESFLRILEPTTEKMAFLAMNFTLPQWIAQRVPWRLNKVVADETSFLRSLCNDIVREKRETLAASKLSAKDLEADILGTMMLGGDFSDTELVDQMLTFLAAGVCFLFLRPRQLLILPARNHSQCPDLGLLLVDPTSGDSGKTPRGDPREDSLCR